MGAASPLLTVVPLILGFIGPGIVIWLRNQGRRRAERRSPITKDMLRPPGYSLSLRLENLQFEADSLLFPLFLGPFVGYTIWLTVLHFGKQKSGLALGLIIAIVVLGVTGFLSRKLLRMLKEIDLIKLGIDGELFTGQELDQLMRHGCRVFHDVPFPYGNIDHVVVSNSGVYSVNTKTCRKHKEGGSAEVFIDHTNNTIRFPDRKWQIPTSQLEAESNWLRKYLTSAVGNPVNVEPILALPGWHISKRIGKGTVFVINPVSPRKFFVHRRQVHSPEDIQRIAHQLEQLVRDIKPSQRLKDGWEGE